MTQRPGCDRFETEKRDPYDDDPAFTEHLKRCDDCRTIHTAHLRIARAIGRVHEDAKPPTGWQERVLEKMAELEADVDPSSADRVTIVPAAPQPLAEQRQRPRRLSRRT
jgi:hypothetical protein